jgi:hypothetical protein
MGTKGLILHSRYDGYVIEIEAPWKPLKNTSFCPIPASGSNFNPPPNFELINSQNTQCIDACPGGFFIGVVKIFTFLGLEQN